MAVWSPANVFQSTLPVKGATLGGGFADPSRRVSIHAPREGSDPLARRETYTQVVSIHAPREGSDAEMLDMTVNMVEV